MALVTFHDLYADIGFRLYLYEFLGASQDFHAPRDTTLSMPICCNDQDHSSVNDHIDG
jgi:hypothetical protein